MQIEWMLILPAYEKVRDHKDDTTWLLLDYEVSTHPQLSLRACVSLDLHLWTPDYSFLYSERLLTAARAPKCQWLTRSSQIKATS
jgi:hypothetical protein